MNSQIQSQPQDSNEISKPALVADPKLTMSPRKLAGSECCLNCNTELKGPFCYYCGQPDRNFMRFFPALLRDLMEDLLDFDSRFMRTLKPLMFKPGRLTKDFMSGRRFRYTPPMRLYIFSSIVFFLLAALLSSDLITTDTVKQTTDESGVIHFSAATEEEKKQVEEALDKLPSDLRAKIVHDAVGSDTATAEDEEDMFSAGEISFNGEPWDRETNPVDIPFVPQWINDRLNDEVENSPKKAKQINENPNLFVDKLFDILPATMFVLLPIVALIFKFWYSFAKRYYVEHLIFSLHNHAFIFVCLTILLLMNETGDLLGNRGYAGLSKALEWTVIAIWAWIPIYMLIALRVVYQQNWPLTILKFGAIGISYFTLLVVVTTAVAVTSFILL
jgi:hypothetical protein